MDHERLVMQCRRVATTAVIEALRRRLQDDLGQLKAAPRVGAAVF
jgi:hypothetical protein